jgi:hypothetical protein
MTLFRAGLVWLALGAGLLGETQLPAQVQLLAGGPPQAVFAGAARPISAVWRNAGDVMARLQIRIRVYQTTSATAAILGETAGKELQLLPHQTILESAMIPFPAVRTPTRFLVQWRDGEVSVLGYTDVTAYPSDLLKAWQPLAADGGLGVYDPGEEIQPLLRSAGVKFVDLEESGWRNFTGKWAVVGPCAPEEGMRTDLAEQVRRFSARGIGVVWLRSPGEGEAMLPPAICVVPQKKSVVVTVPADLVSDPADRPRSQLNLIYALQLADDTNSALPPP